MPNAVPLHNSKRQGAFAQVLKDVETRDFSVLADAPSDLIKEETLTTPQARKSRMQRKSLPASQAQRNEKPNARHLSKSSSGSASGSDHGSTPSKESEADSGKEVISDASARVPMVHQALRTDSLPSSYDHLLKQATRDDRVQNQLDLEDESLGWDAAQWETLNNAQYLWHMQQAQAIAQIQQAQWQQARALYMQRMAQQLQRQNLELRMLQASCRLRRGTP